MKHLLIMLLSLVIFISCKKDDNRTELPGTPTSIKGNIADRYRNIQIENFEIKLIKFGRCTSGMKSTICDKVIATTRSDKDGNYKINFEYNLRDDEEYRITYDNSTPYVFEFVDFPVKPVFEKGIENILNINAWTLIKIKVKLTVLNNHTPPLVTGISNNGKYEFGTHTTYGDESKLLEINARPNSDVSIDFWYNENYNTSNPIRHLKSFPYRTSTVDSEILEFEIDCNEF